MTAYYNEIDPAAVAVLRELIDRDVIAPGDVDDRSIKEVSPDELSGYTQCHFFAGAGIWSAAARLAGWPDDRKLWTGSCPCQPFSQAGKGLGTDDPRHLWPDFHRLIRACRPPVIMGEQVAGSAGYGWFDGVRADLAREDYAGRAVDIPACAIDGPHQRNRLYWTAVDNRVGARLEGQCGHVTSAAEGRSIQGGPSTAANDLVFSDTQEQRGRAGLCETGSQRHGAFASDGHGGLQPDANRDRHQADSARGSLDFGETICASRPNDRSVLPRRHDAQKPNGSFWSDAEWIVSPLDGKARRTKPGLPFLVDGLAGRADSWRIAGNSIVLPLAAEVIAAFLDAENLSALSPQYHAPDER